MNRPTTLPRQPNKRTPTRSADTRRRMDIAASAAFGAPRALPGVRRLSRLSRSKIFALVLIVALAVGLFLFFDSNLFFVFDFNVAGLQMLTKPEIARTSGIVGYNIFFIDSQQVERAILKLPEVKSAQVAATLPNRVTITVVERQPEIVWMRGGELYWIATDGLVLRARTQQPNLPAIRDLDQAAITPGKLAPPDAVIAYRALRQVWSDSPRNFEWSKARGLAFTDERGWKIYLGDADKMAGKIAILRALIPSLVAQGKKITFIDLGKGDPYYQ